MSRKHPKPFELYPDASKDEYLHVLMDSVENLVAVVRLGANWGPETGLRMAYACEMGKRYFEEASEIMKGPECDCYQRWQDLRTMLEGLPVGPYEDHI